MELLNYRKLIGENISLFIRLKGYSKSSFAKLTDISRPTLNQILIGESPNPKTYKEQIKKITDALELPVDFFLVPPVISMEKWQTPTVQYSDRVSDGDRGHLVKELLEDLNDLMSVTALYL